MVSARTFAAALAVAAPLASAANFDNTKPFVLFTEIVKGDVKFENQYITSFNSDASESALIGTSNAADAIEWSINGTQLVRKLSGNQIFLVEQQPTDSDAPIGYELVNISNVPGTSGWTLQSASDLPTATLVHDAQYGRQNFQGFALCQVNGTAPSPDRGAQLQLLWKSADSKVADDYKTCADVNLVASNPV